MCKEYGGLGIPNLRDLNICMLASWLKRYTVDRDKLDYNTCNPNILQTRTEGASCKWQEWATVGG